MFPPKTKRLFSEPLFPIFVCVFLCFLPPKRLFCLLFIFGHIFTTHFVFLVLSHTQISRHFTNFLDFPHLRLPSSRDILFFVPFFLLESIFSNDQIRANVNTRISRPDYTDCLHTLIDLTAKSAVKQKGKRAVACTYGAYT